MSKKLKVIALLGPTACGKTSLALKLALKFDLEIVNCDSRQIYREMNIGTAKPNKAQLELVKHRLFDIITPDKSFSAGDYAIAASECIKEICARGKTPLLTGGTGYYYETLSEGLGQAGNNEALAKKLKKELEDRGVEAMLDKLDKLDDKAREIIDINNSRKILRALEIVITTNKPLSENKRVRLLPEARFFPVVVSRPRTELHASIEKRTKQMLKAGLENEVKELCKRYLRAAPGLNSIGYKEWFDYFDKKISLKEVEEAILIHTRQYAKRQETWFRHRPGVKTRNLSLAEAESQIFAEAEGFLLAK